MNQAPRKIPKILPWVFVLAALMPPLAMTLLLSLTGDNNLSNDVWPFASLVERILGGGYEWKNYFRDTFLVNHSFAMAIPFHLLAARFFHWNAFFLIYLGILFGLARVFLIYDILRCLRPSGRPWVLLPLISGLVFSFSSLTLYEYDFIAPQFGASLCAFFLGLWFLTRFPDRWLGIWGMALSGLWASLCWGGGPFVWPIYFLFLFFSGNRKWSIWIVSFFFAVLGSLPYLVYLTGGANPNRPHVSNWFNFRFILSSLGYAFSPNFDPIIAWHRGIWFAVLLAGGIFVFQRKRLGKRNNSILAAWLMVGFGVLVLWQISLFRDVWVPWYISVAMVAWLGLASLAYLAWPQDWKSWKKLPDTIWSIMVLSSIVVFFANSNLEYRDKTFFLRNRSPVAASCLRNFETAPTYCEGFLFVWPPGNYSTLSGLGAPLERNGWSVFAPHQHWTLQGDFVLDSVRLLEKHGFIPDIYWTEGLDSRPVPFTDYHHLNLFVHSPNSVAWTVYLPPSIKSAEFHSAIAISSSTPPDPNADGILFKVLAERPGKPDLLLYARYVGPQQKAWIPFSISLKEFKGQKVTLRLGSETVGNPYHDWGMYRFPFINVVDSKRGSSVLSSHPSNTDLAMEETRLSGQDYSFDLKPGKEWEYRDLVPQEGGDGLWGIRANPVFSYKKPLDVDLSAYSKIYFRMSATEDITPRAARIFLRLSDKPDTVRDVAIPLLPDGQMHSYTYNLKNLELNQFQRLVGLAWSPVERQSFSAESRVQISDFRLLKEP